MPLSAECPSCAKKYQVKDDAGGKSFLCKVCGEKVKVPKASRTVSKPKPAADSDSSRPAAAKASSSKPGRPKPRPDEEEAVDPFLSALDDAVDDGASAEAPLDLMPRKRASRPRRDLDEEFDSDDDFEAREAPTKKRRPRRERDSRPSDGISLSNFHIDRAIIFCLVIGVVLFFIAFQEMRLSSLSKPEPQRMTLADLVARGPGDNIHIELTDVHLMLEEAVVETRQVGGVDVSWSAVWFPAVATQAVAPAAPVVAPVANPAGGPPLAPGMPPNLTPPGMMPGMMPAAPAVRGPVKLILKTTNIKNEGDALTFIRKGSFRGMITNSVHSLGSKEIKLLQEGLPGTDVASCHLFEDGKAPSGPIKFFLLLGGGVALTLFGLFLMFKPG